jgi:ethanolamine utilization protein EutM
VPREALGLVETRGMVAAVEAADAMCKTARVRLTRFEVTRDALVTVTVRGALAEVEAAAGKGEVFARHVIPSPEGQLEESIAGPSPGAAARGNDTTP